MVTTQRISPCLWFADQAEEAARFYTGISNIIAEFMRDEQSAGAQRATNAMFKMKKLNIAELQRAYDGTA